MKRIVLGLAAFVLLALINVVTVVLTLNHSGVTRAGSVKLPDYKADANNDDNLNLADPVYLLSYLFNSGNPPAVFAGSGESQLTDEELKLLKDVLSHLSVEYLDDGVGGDLKTIRFSGVNLQIVNGLGATNGNITAPGAYEPTETAANGLGNLIVGYNEAGSGLNPEGDKHIGSHYVVVGNFNNYTGFGGIVAGRAGNADANYATILGGLNNQSLGAFSAVVGGGYNTAEGDYSTIVGGGSLIPDDGNLASGEFSTVITGSNNEASGTASVVVGGTGSSASGERSAVVAGTFNFSLGDRSAVLGGGLNVAYGINAVVDGGQENEATGDHSVVSGGLERDADGEYDWVAGTLLEEE